MEVDRFWGQWPPIPDAHGYFFLLQIQLTSQAQNHSWDHIYRILAKNSDMNSNLETQFDIEVKCFSIHLKISLLYSHHFNKLATGTYPM